MYAMLEKCSWQACLKRLKATAFFRSYQTKNSMQQSGVNMSRPIHLTHYDDMEQLINQPNSNGLNMWKMKFIKQI